MRGLDEMLFSQEGVTQGDPLSMQMYAMAVLPLIHSQKVAHPEVTQNWYADDASAVGDLDHLKDWLASLVQNGPSVGYFPEPHKSYLIVAPSFVDQAKLSSLIMAFKW